MAGPVATGYLELDLSGFNRAIESAKKALTVLTAAFAAIKVAEFFKDGVKEAINFGNEMYNAGKAMGNIDPGVLLIAKKALEGSGLAAGRTSEEIERIITSQQKFSRLFKTQADYEKAMSRAKEVYGDQAAVLSNSAGKLSRVFEYIQGVSDKLKTFFLAMTAKFIEPLEAVLNLLNRINVADFGAKFGTGISNASSVVVGLFKNENISEFLGLALSIAFDYATEKLNEALGGTLSDAASKFGDDLISKIWELKDVFLIIADLFIAKISAGLMNISPPLKKIGEFIGKITGQKTPEEIASDEMNAIRERLAIVKDSGRGGGGFGDFATGLSMEGKAAQDALAKLTDAAKTTGEASIKANAGDQDKTQLNYQALGKQDPFSVIASSMAKIGGGGNYIQTGMSAEARQLIINGQAAQFTNELIQKTNSILEKGMKVTPVLQ